MSRPECTSNSPSLISYQFMPFPWPGRSPSMPSLCHVAPLFCSLCISRVSHLFTLQAVEAVDSERDVLQAELDSKAEQVANLTEELDLGHQQADDANRQVHMYHCHS